MTSSRFDECLKCKKGGKVLMCIEEDCPNVVHKECLGIRATFDAAGNFECPYCMSRKAYAELNRAREDMKLKKRAMYSFIAKIEDCNKQKDISGNEGSKRKAPFCERDDDLIFHEDAQENQESANLGGSPSVQEMLSEGEKDNPVSLGGNEKRENNHHKTASTNENNSMLNISLGADGGGKTSNKISEEHSPLPSKSKRAKVHSPCRPSSSNVDSSGRSSPAMSKSPEKTKKTNIATEVSREISTFAGRSKTIWTEKEEALLKKGVEKQASQGTTNISWKKILDSGRHVFHHLRTPDHLKDKWRRMNR